MEATERFRALFAQPEPQIALDEAALLVAAHGVAGLDVDRELVRIDDLAERCSAPTLDALARHLFVDLAFRGNHRDYYDPRNSYLNEVMTRRVGIPISLSVLTIAVGRRIGVPLAGVSMPGHFLLRYRVDPEVFVDPFDGGALLDRAGCARAFRRVHGEGAVFDDEFLAPVGTFSILARMLANLRAIFAAHGDHRALVWVIKLRTMLPDTSLDDRGELAAALAATGSFAEAADVFDQLAEQLGGSPGEAYARRAVALRARLN